MARSSRARDCAGDFGSDGFMDVFGYCFGIVLGSEGGLSTDPADPGNWTGGVVGRGKLSGTKYGIAASAYPNLDIAALTEAQAQAIIRALYWVRIAGDTLPATLALLALDAAVNNGVSRAIRWLQAASGCAADGVLGPLTLAAVAAAQARDPDALMIEFQAQRLMFMAALSTWPTFGLGWARRLCGLPFQALPLFASPPPVPSTAKAAAS